MEPICFNHPNFVASSMHEHIFGESMVPNKTNTSTFRKVKKMIEVEIERTTPGMETN